MELPGWATALANVGWWAVVHAGTGYAVHRLPPSRLESDGPVLRLRTWEAGGRAYEHLGIRQWKDRLPEAGAIFRGGRSKRRLPARDGDGLVRFAVETRRAERGHWLAMAGGPFAALWNPAGRDGRHGRLRRGRQPAVHRGPALQPRPRRPGTGPVEDGHGPPGGGHGVAHQGQQHPVGLAAAEVVVAVRLAEPLEVAQARAGAPAPAGG